MLEICRACLNCFYKDSNGRLIWKNDLKNSDVFDLFKLMKVKNSNGIDTFDNEKIFELLTEVEGPLKRRTVIRKFEDFKSQCVHKTKDVFLNHKFDGICTKVDHFRNRFLFYY